MKHVTLNNIEYVVVRQQPGRDTELVDVRTGVVSWHDSRTVGFVTQHEHYTVPDSIPFPNRDPQFLRELRAERSRMLDGAQKRKREPAPRKPKGTTSRQRSKLDSIINSVVPEHLRAFVKAQTGKRKAS